MIIYQKNDEIDREQWDNCIKNSSVSKPYAYSWYLDIVAPGWEALMDDDYDSVFPVPSYVRFGIKYTSTPPFVKQLGAFSPDKPASEMITEFLDYMPEIYKLTDLCVGQRVVHPGYKVSEKSNYELDLSLRHEKIFEKFTPQCRKYISGAVKKGYELTHHVTPEELYELCLENKALNFTVANADDYKRFIDLMHYCIDNRKGKITGVRAARKKLVYGIFTVKIPGSITIIQEANTPGSIEKHISYFVINEIIKENASAAAILDFAGTYDTSAVPAGKSFGGINVPFYRIRRNRLFWPARVMKS